MCPSSWSTPYLPSRCVSLGCCFDGEQSVSLLVGSEAWTSATLAWSAAGVDLACPGRSTAPAGDAPSAPAAAACSLVAMLADLPLLVSLGFSSTAGGEAVSAGLYVGRVSRTWRTPLRWLVERPLLGKLIGFLIDLPGRLFDLLLDPLLFFRPQLPWPVVLDRSALSPELYLAPPYDLWLRLRLQEVGHVQPALMPDAHL